MKKSKISLKENANFVILVYYIKITKNNVKSVNIDAKLLFGLRLELARKVPSVRFYQFGILYIKCVSMLIGGNTGLYKFTFCSASFWRL